MRSWSCNRLALASVLVVAVLVVASGIGGCGNGPDGSSAGAAPGGPAAPSAPQRVADAPPKRAPRHKIIGDRQADTPTGPVAMSKQTETSPFRFTEIAKEAGIDFVHVSGMTPERHFPSANGSGVGVFDFDNDGKPDIYFATCTLLPPGTAQKGPNRLYKNLGDNKFQDVSAKAGVDFRGFCHGVVVGDIDNDGDQDLFLCNYGPNVLYLNNGDGTFADISKAAGVDVGRRYSKNKCELTGDKKTNHPDGTCPDDEEKVEVPNWSSGGAFLDYDNDGDLDLYVANYGEWVLPYDDKFCGDPEAKVRLYCSPRSIRTVKHLLYRNNGDRTFTEVYDRVIQTVDPETKQPKPRSDGHGFGVVTADLNGDGKIDIYVANDMNPNFLFLNNGDGTFEDATEASGAAYDEKGQAQSGMGVDAEDVDGDGLPELFVTNFANEYNTLYQNLGKGTFMDSTPFFGLAADTMPWVGWGTALADLDNDGWPDNFVTNGHVDDNRRQLDEDVDYEEPALLFYNLKGRGIQRFRLATRDAGPYFDAKHVGRGAAFGDLDNDGDIDIVVNHKGGAPALLRNDTQHGNHWVRLELRGTRSNRDAIGARIEVEAGGRTIYRQRKGGYSLESANDPRVLVGIGTADEVTKLTVRWPSGAVSSQERLKADRSYSIVEPEAAKTASAGLQGPEKPARR
jgi:hypothetical protein